MNACRFYKWLLSITCFIFAQASFAQTAIIPYGSTWKYLANGTDQGTAWRATGFNDAAWPSGPGELGYGDADEATVVSYGPDANNKYITTYFRYAFNLPDPTLYSSFTLNLVYDDGAVIYINGNELQKIRMPSTVAYNTLANSPAIEETIQTISVPVSSFVAGNNVIAVEMHQQSVTSTDISFDMELIGNDVFSAGLTRGPYLQMGNETAITIRWRTSASQNSRVELGTSYGSYPVVVNDATNTTEHIVRVTGLTADTKYYYRIGNSTNMSAPDINKFFTTVPSASTSRKIRIAAFGDCGRSNSAYQDQNLANYRSFLTTNGIDAADAWLLLGDNAYDSGTDAEFSSKFFGIYASTILKNHKLYPAPGNHDYGNVTGNKTLRSMAYYNSFTTPLNGECGGVASNKPNFYSFDIGNIHFLSLDSWGIETDMTNIGTAGNSTLKTWINNDLTVNTKKWVIAYWHHPPYTKGGHDSDTETELVDIRQNFITYLEARGVDMIICGHSHAYERGYLMKNFTGTWNSFTPAAHAVSNSSATYTGNSTCPFIYNSTPLNHGTVYVVAGSSGASGTPVSGFGTNAFPFAVNDGGIFYFEVEGNRLDAKMLRRNGTVFDKFTIMKDVNKTTDASIAAGQSITLTASWPGNATYIWSNTAQTTRSISVSPPEGNYSYNVTDNFGCLTDHFTLSVTPVIPVQMINYDVRLDKNIVHIDWTTASENNSKTFTVEKSADGATFSLLTIIQAMGNSSSEKKYAVVDQQPLKGTSYYRLSQQDIDGRTKYFEVKKIVNKEGKTFEIKCLAGTGNVRVLVTTTRDARTIINIYDMNGRKVRSENWNIVAGTNDKSLILPAGSYILEMINDNNERFSSAIVIQ